MVQTLSDRASKRGNDHLKKKLEATLEIQKPESEKETGPRKIHHSHPGNYRAEVLRNGVKRQKPTKVFLREKVP